MPGALSFSFPFPPLAEGCTSSWPPSSASSVRTRRADKTRVPPEGCEFQLPVALAWRSRSCSISVFLPVWAALTALAVLTVACAVCALASKRVRAPWPCTSARPSSGSGPICVCSSAGLTCCSVALSCQAGAGVAVSVAGGFGLTVHSPLAISSPPPSWAFRVRTMAAPFRHSPWVSRLSTGRRFWSQGPGRVLASWSCRVHAGLALAAVMASGCTWALPVSRVCGASGHRAARSRSLKVASACGRRCAAQGVTRAVALTRGCAAGFAPLAAGFVAICSSALTSSSVSGPFAVA